MPWPACPATIDRRRRPSHSPRSSRRRSVVDLGPDSVRVKGWRSLGRLDRSDVRSIATDTNRARPLGHSQVERGAFAMIDEQAQTIEERPSGTTDVVNRASRTKPAGCSPASGSVKSSRRPPGSLYVNAYICPLNVCARSSRPSSTSVLIGLGVKLVPSGIVEAPQTGGLDAATRRGPVLRRRSIPATDKLARPQDRNQPPLIPRVPHGNEWFSGLIGYLHFEVRGRAVVGESPGAIAILIDRHERRGLATPIRLRPANSQPVSAGRSKAEPSRGAACWHSRPGRHARSDGDPCGRSSHGRESRRWLLLDRLAIHAGVGLLGDPAPGQGLSASSRPGRARSHEARDLAGIDPCQPAGQARLDHRALVNPRDPGFIAQPGADRTDARKLQSDLALPEVVELAAPRDHQLLPGRDRGHGKHT